MKVHIIGCSGSGKTYLAKLLSSKYNIPHFSMGSKCRGIRHKNAGREKKYAIAADIAKKRLDY